MSFSRCFLLLGCLANVCCAGESAVSVAEPPAVQRELRAAWIATVANIDWPTKPGLDAQTQRDELSALLDKAVELRLNAVVLQVRPACDALYQSDLEPWSEYLSGQQGQPPSAEGESGYDPLEWATSECHRRGLELHAWFNPYRAGHKARQSELSDKHLAKVRPEIVKTYGGQLWLDPGEPDAAAHSLAVVLDVVRRYDVDGVHFDDYFYPYPVSEEDADGVSRELPFPDGPSWKKYCDSTPAGERLSRDDWRRDNVNRFIRDVYEGVHRIKPHVRVGVSPFGIWRPGHPEQIKGFDAYAKLYADSRLWLQEGWVDYFTPQLYWPIAQEAQSFPVLLAWWRDQNPLGRGLWPGLFTSKARVGNPPWEPSEIIDQIGASRELIDEPGCVHFSMKALSQNYSGVADALRDGPYAQFAMVPAAPWLASGEPIADAPELKEASSGAGAASVWSATASGRDTPRWWLVQQLRDGQWGSRLVSGETTEVLRTNGPNKLPEALAVSAVDRFGRLGKTAIVTLE